MSDVTTAVRNCKVCGVEVMIPDLPEDIDPKWIGYMDAIGVTCDPCLRADDAQRRDDAVSQRAATRNRRIREADIPSALQGHTLAELDTDGRKTALRFAREWVDGKLPGLVLTGEVGVGKTTIAAAAAWEMVQRDRLRWVSVPVLMARLSGGFGSPDRGEALRVLSGHTALVLDDLDKTRPSEYGAEQLFLAIDSRLTAGVPLLITTNLTPAAIGDRFPDQWGPSIASRLVGYCRVVEVTGQDRRRRRTA